MKVKTYLKQLKKIGDIFLDDIDKYSKEDQSIIYSIRAYIQNELGDLEEIENNKYLWKN